MSSLLYSSRFCNGIDFKQPKSFFADWSVGGWHPKEFEPDDLERSLVDRMRGLGKRECNAGGAIGTAVSALFQRTMDGSGDTKRDGVTKPHAVVQEVESAAIDPRAVGRRKCRLLMPHRSTACEAYGHADPSITRQHQAPRKPRKAESLLSKNGSNINGTRNLLRRVRRVDAHSADDKIGNGRQLKSALGTEDLLEWVLREGYQPLGYDCSLFGRKFPASLAHHALEMALSCNGIGLGSWCQ